MSKTETGEKVSGTGSRSACLNSDQSDRNPLLLLLKHVFSRRKEAAGLAKDQYHGPKVSVIVPIYNAEDYLQQCLESIVSQTLKELEIICVNDGSTDGSVQIIKEYADKDPRIIVINKENSGYGASVNRGLDQAGGEYIGIVEADDFIEKDMYKLLYDRAKKFGNIDIVKGSYWQYFDTEDCEGKRVAAPINKACKPQKDVFDVWEYPEIIYHHPSIWSCIYRRDFLENCNVRMVEAEGAGWVDNPFLLQTFCLAKTLSWTPEPLYDYRQTNPNASSYVRDCSMPFRRTAEMLAFLDERGIEDERIRGSVYKRILYNTAAALKNPYYDPQKDEAIIIGQIKQVPSAFLLQKRVNENERKAYAFFSS